MPTCACNQTVVVDGVDIARCQREAPPGAKLCEWCQKHHAELRETDLEGMARGMYEAGTAEVGRIYPGYGGQMPASWDQLTGSRPWRASAAMWRAAARYALGAFGPGRAVITYDPDLLEVGRVVALRLKRNRQATPTDRKRAAADVAVLADVFEEITRQLPLGE